MISVPLRMAAPRLLAAVCVLLLPCALLAETRREALSRRDLLLRAARNQVKARQLEKAATYYREYLDLWPDDHRIGTEYAGVLIQAEKVDDAIAVLAPIVTEKAPSHQPAIVLLADAYMIKRDFAKSADLLARAVELSPADNLRRKLADVYAWAQRYDEAVRQYRLLLVSHPDDVGLERKILQMMYWGRMTERYLDESIKFLQRHPRDVAVRLTRVDLLAMNKDFAGAARECRVLLRFDPRNRLAQARLAQLLNWLGDHENAIKEYAAALALDPKDTGLLREYGQLLIWTRRFHEAVSVYRRLLAELPGDENVIREYLQAAAGATPVTEPERERIRGFYRSHFTPGKGLQPATLAALAQALAAAGAGEDALAVFQAALKALPEDVGLRLQYADLLATLGRAEEAERQYQVLLQRADETEKEPRP